MLAGHCPFPIEVHGVPHQMGGVAEVQADDGREKGGVERGIDGALGDEEEAYRGRRHDGQTGRRLEPPRAAEHPRVGPVEELVGGEQDDERDALGLSHDVPVQQAVKKHHRTGREAERAEPRGRRATGKGQTEAEAENQSQMDDRGGAEPDGMLPGRRQRAADKDQQAGAEQVARRPLPPDGETGARQGRPHDGKDQNEIVDGYVVRNVLEPPERKKSQRGLVASRRRSKPMRLDGLPECFLLRLVHRPQGVLLRHLGRVLPFEAAQGEELLVEGHVGV